MSSLLYFLLNLDRPITHNIQMKLGLKVRENPQPLPQELRGTMKREPQSMLELKVIGESFRDWKRPVVLVPKPDWTTWFSNDFQKVNTVSKFDV